MRLVEAGFGAQCPVTSPGGDLAFSQVSADTDIVRFGAEGATRQLVPASGLDTTPDLERRQSIRPEVPCVIGGAAVALGPLGIYHLPCPKSGTYETDQPLHAYNPSTRREVHLGRLKGYHRFGDLYRPTFRALAVSPDGETVLYNRRVSVSADLMVIRGSW